MKQASTLEMNNMIQYLESSELKFFLATKDTEQKTIVVKMFQILITIFKLSIKMEWLLKSVSSY